MKIKFLAVAVGIAMCGASAILHAEGNPRAGKDKAAACNSCHGDNGNSMAPNFPKLAQQHASYLAKQLQAFKSGGRNDPIMSPMALPLSEEDMADIAAYYATQKISGNSMPVLPPPDEDEDEDEQAAAPVKSKSVPELIAQGSNLYRNGDRQREVSACIACHGPFGEGNLPAAFPALRSQHADYLIKALTDFKTGARGNTPENMMHMIAQKMTDEEIRAVAYHISMMK
ncbi:c-type cytochrome [Candidatus Methylomicrobium oryzae]|jgi:cytochrome c553|uniref:c-type cytochrome n=1 Tax=Candidatus Methylomicrobium oryzae TaxID=2802053 RepID=UPI0019210B14|nr:c-type cytochrome [Methylomicrobium sp. RS1]MBL1262727.1 cytochrome c4 [Methylomicrobium sp. RS1]